MNKGRKITGGKYHKNRKKKFHERIRQHNLTSVRPAKRKNLRIAGGNRKTILLSADIANVNTIEKTKKAEIKSVKETPQNKFLARQNRLLKGALIETSLGIAKITNRPTQEGMVNAVLISKE